MVKYTFLLPAYKGRFLNEMLQSIQSQTYKDFKVIISDDCSPEDLKTICEPYLQDPRFTYRRNIENMGGKSLVSHWNMLVEMCDTEWLIMASDDDIYDLRFLEQIDCLTTKYPIVDLLRAKMCYINQEGRMKRIDMLLHEYESQIEFIHDNFCSDRLTCIANYVFRTCKLKAIGGFVDFPLAWGSDQATCMQMAANGVANTHDSLLSFRLSGMNITTKENSQIAKQKVYAVLALDLWMKDFLRSLPEPKTHEEECYWDFVVDSASYGMAIWHHLKGAPLNVFFQVFRKIKQQGYWSGSQFLLWFSAKIKGK